ncbi:MAG: hypothetical protein OEW31_01625 [Thermoleophilia bacterium]|nr:hypothetical protein [Thermoleophilia bacterium]MDH4345013.1 hypothetical protein [Thermoleophilia bacterium]MDH5333667.1 hypothetical protein [Thermoleophilia bacterium]
MGPTGLTPGVRLGRADRGLAHDLVLEAFDERVTASSTDFALVLARALGG